MHGIGINTLVISVLLGGNIAHFTGVIAAANTDIAVHIVHSEPIVFCPEFAIFLVRATDCRTQNRIIAQIHKRITARVVNLVYNLFNKLARNTERFYHNLFALFYLARVIYKHIRKFCKP